MRLCLSAYIKPLQKKVALSRKCTNLILFLLIVVLLASCQVVGNDSGYSSSSSSDPDLPVDIVEKLAMFPAEYHEICKRTDIAITDHGKAINNELWDSFYSAVQKGQPADVVTAMFTTEGDPILAFIRFDGTQFFCVTDNSRDNYGVEPYYRSNTFSHLQLLKDTDTIFYILSDIFFDDWEDYTGFCQSDPQKYPETIFWTVEMS